MSSQDAERCFDAVRHTLETRPNDLDVLGHVNNATALEYLEAARWDWAKRMGLGKPGADFVAVVTRIEIDYLRQMLPGKLDVRTQFVHPGPDWREDANYKAVARQTIFPYEGEKALVEAAVTIAFIDVKTQALRTIQDCLLTVRE
jgi:acyl-CoA thioester hydrolase